MRKKSLVLTFGRFNPPTAGHCLVVETMRDHAPKNSDIIVGVSQTHDKVRNPLTPKQKIECFKNILPNNLQRKISFINSNTIFEILENNSGKYGDVIICLGSDRLENFKDKITPYIGNRMLYDSIKFITPATRDDSNSISGVSATKARQAKSIDEFKLQMPEHVNDVQKLEQCFLDVKKAMI